MWKPLNNRQFNSYFYQNADLLDEEIFHYYRFMKIVYSRTKEMNFGDDLNLWLWPKLIPQCLRKDDGIAFLGIGTIISKHIYFKHLASAQKIVLFSGGAGEKEVPVIDAQWKVYCVRGPRTAQKLKISTDYAIADGAYLLRTMGIRKPEKKYKFAFVPHHRSEDYVDWGSICAKAGIGFISPRQPVERFLSEILSCGKIVTEAMHGAITADAFRIPWVPVRFATNFYEEKWRDFFESMSMAPDIEILPVMYQYRQPLWRLFRNSVKNAMFKVSPASEKWSKLPVAKRLAADSELAHLASELKKIAHDAPGVLSEDLVVEDVTRRLTEKLDLLKSDYLSGNLKKNFFTT